MDLKMIQNIYERVASNKLYVESTSSSDCKSLEPNDGNGYGYLICKSFPTGRDYQWKIVELDEWKMLKSETEAYYEKGEAEYNEIEKVYSLLTKK